MVVWKNHPPLRPWPMASLFLAHRNVTVGKMSPLDFFKKNCKSRCYRYLAMKSKIKNETRYVRYRSTAGNCLGKTSLGRWQFSFD